MEALFYCVLNLPEDKQAGVNLASIFGLSHAIKRSETSLFPAKPGKCLVISEKQSKN